MKCKNERRDEFSILTPWEIEDEETPINKYCSDLAEHRKTLVAKKNNLPVIRDKKRAASHCNHLRSENPPMSDKNILAKTHCQFAQQNNDSRPFHTLAQHKSEKKKIEKVDKIDKTPLQEISIKNFVIEGGHENLKEKMVKKRQSTYILKQKFAEFRRSAKFMMPNKQNQTVKIVRYE